MGEAALVATPKSDKPKQKRLTDADKAMALRYEQEGLTQVDIAQRLGVTQPAISQWLAQCRDTTAEASLYFRGRALPMAEKIVKRGRPSDLIKALQGVGVLEPEKSAGLVIQIGVKDSDVQINLSTFAPEPSALSPSLHSVTGDLGSDNGAYVVNHQAPAVKGSR